MLGFCPKPGSRAYLVVIPIKIIRVKFFQRMRFRKAINNFTRPDLKFPLPLSLHHLLDEISYASVATIFMRDIGRDCFYFWNCILRTSW